jgi:SAM-dependent methyltransferase
VIPELPDAGCPCCGAAIEGPPAFVHPAVPVLLNVLATSEHEARSAPSGRLELFECPECGLVFNRAFEGVPYGQQYFLDATRSPRYRQHLDDVSDRLAARLAPRSPFSVIDVGAGQGTFLAHLVGRLGGHIARAHGFDPAFRSAQAKLPSNVGFTASLLDARGAAALAFPVDVVVTRHVLEHVLDPVRFLASFREALPCPFGLLVETPNVAHTLERGLLHDFCYEHCAMVGDVALSEALRRSGYERVRVESAFGGEYLLAFACASAATPRDRAPEPSVRTTRPPASNRLAEMAKRFVPEHRERLRQARTRGPVALWGGAGKGALFAHLVDPDRALVDCVVDIHPGKQGFFLPGAGHRVVAPEDARRAGVRTVVVANATYVDEVASLCDAHGLRVELECVGDRRFARTISGGK